MDTKARQIIGLPVVSFSTGSKLYEVEDLILDPERKQVLALVVSEKQLFHSARAIPFGRINAIGPDAVIVPDGKAVINVDRDKLLKSLYNDRMVKGLRVLTEDGRKLGEIADMLIDTQTGEIKGYYVTMGRMLAVGQGMRWLPADSVINMGSRVAYVPTAVADDFATQSGGLSGALTGAGDKLREAGAKANTNLEGWGGKAITTGEKFNEQLGRYGDQVRQTIPQRAGEYAVGKTAHRAVDTPEGTSIVEKGAVITEEHVETARVTGRLPQLLMSAGTAQAQRSLNDMGGEGAGLGDMQTEARDLWGQVSTKWTQYVDQADDKFMEKRIKHALGRPASRVILDADDNIILNTGDIITNRAVLAAREAGVLDILVDSVYTEKPKLALEELKAPRSGDASLENAVSAESNGISRRGSRTDSTSKVATAHSHSTDAK